jgi:hypothetical protein
MLLRKAVTPHRTLAPMNCQLDFVLLSTATELPADNGPQMERRSPTRREAAPRNAPGRRPALRFPGSHGLRAGVFSALLGFFSISSSQAQGTQADYERASNLRRMTGNKVFRDRVQPTWLPGGTQFWYQVRTGPESHEYVLVKAEKGERGAAFDHARLAGALAKAGVEDVRADRLSLDKLEFKLSENALVFRKDGKRWHCDLASYALSETASAREESLPPLSIEDAPKASARTGAETSLTFVNRTPAEVELFWLDADGQRQSYGKLDAGAERDQHTFAGHVWLAVDAAGRTLAVFQAEERPGKAEIAARPTFESPRRQFDARRRGPGSRETSPDGKWRAYVKDHNLMVRSLEDGEEVALSSDGSAEDAYGDRVYWSPDSKRLVGIRTRAGDERKIQMVESSPKDQLQPKLHTLEYRKPGDRIPVAKPQLFDVVAQRQIPVSDELFPNPWSISDVRWAPDSSRFSLQPARSSGAAHYRRRGPHGRGEARGGRAERHVHRL